jgi:formylglycine-generating enzyme required for sulfatase activity
VTVSKPFAAGKFEVTFEAWDACVAEGGCKHKPGDMGWGRGSRPVINVSWDDIEREYLPWLRRQTGHAYRLLTEAEWEYAAWAGLSSHRFAWGSDNHNANCRGCGSIWDNNQTAPVGSFKPNEFGLSDMHGNVWEWVVDCYQSNYSDAPVDGSARVSERCESRTVRGGSWRSDASDVRATNRDGVRATTRIDFIGFRVARTLAP